VIGRLQSTSKTPVPSFKTGKRSAIGVDGASGMAHVLVVDDDEGIRESLRWALEDAGHAVSEAPDGVTAVELLRASPRPLVAVLDIVMPDGDGVAVLHAVRDDPWLVGRHCYLVTTASPPHRFHLPDDVACLLALPVIHKPFDLDEFLAAVEKAAALLPCE
jgi:CheY-like chemotaxis protein